jgi:RHS repeat-associated protein
MRAGQLAVGHPVDVATGTVSTSSIDVSIGGRVPLVLEREFANPSSGTATGPFGAGWSTRYEATLWREGAAFRFAIATGVAAEFLTSIEDLQRGAIVGDLAAGAELTLERGEFVVTRWDVESLDVVRYRFKGTSAHGRWLATAFDFGGVDALLLAYDADGRLRRIEQQREQRALLLDYSPQGRVVRVTLTLAGGTSVGVAEYEYRDGTHLVKAIDAAGRADSYSYDGASRLLREAARTGEEFVFSYDARGRCVEAVGPGGYDRKRLRFLGATKSTELTDSHGKKWLYRCNLLGQVQLAISPRGAQEVTEYDEFARVTTTLDPVGQATRFAYDAAGNRVSVAYPNGTETKSEFNQRHQLKSITDPLGATWTYGYDATTGWLTEITYPTGLRWTREFNGSGDLIAVRNSAGGLWTFAYDNLGQLVVVTNALGASTRYEYDERGNVVTLIEPEGGVTRYAYDVTGVLVRVLHQDGSARDVSYNSGGEVVTVRVNEGPPTVFEYGPGASQLRRVIEAGVTSIEFIWDTEPDRLLAVVDANGRRHEFAYDDDGYLVRESFPTGRIVSYIRDLAGFVTERINGAGERTTYKRDPVGRILRATFHDGSVAEFAYDSVGMVVKATNADAVVDIERNQLGDRVKETRGVFSIASEYDEVGLRIRRASSLGRSTTYRYDAQGHLMSLGLSVSEVMEFGLDRQGRELTRRFGGVELASRWDAVGRLVERSVSRAGGLRTGTRDGSAISTRRFVYDRNDRLVEMSDRQWGKRTFRHDALGRVTEVRDGELVVERYEYDANDNVVQYELLGNEIEAGFPDAPKPIASPREVRAGDQVLNDGETSFEYDGDGRLVRRVESPEGGPSRAWEFGWNAMGLLASVVTPDGDRWIYTYDALGRRIRKRGPNGFVEYVWDGNSVMHELPDGESALAKTWTFNPNDFVPIAKQQQSRTYLAVTDHLGTPRELVDRDGRVAWSARFSLWGLLDGLAASEIDCEVRFQGQWHDPESGLHYNDLRYYSPWLASYVSMDPVPLAGGTNAYLYAPNPLRLVDPHGLAADPWPLDSQGRPTGASGTLTRADVRPTGTSPPSVDPPGWQGGAHPHHQQRSHLVADTLGGSGSDPRNIIALTDGSNHPGMSKAEGAVRRHIQKNGGPVKYTVTVNYKNNHKTPSSVTIKAVDKNGKVIVDVKIKNGKRQKQSCCP